MMIDPVSAETLVELLLSEVQEHELFVGDQPTSMALRLYIEHALPSEISARVASALQDPRHMKRMDHIASDAAARERALLRTLIGEPTARGLVVALRAQASTMRHLCECRELSVAASASPGGVVQIADPEDLVTLKVAEAFEQSADEGELEVEVCSFDDPRLINAAGTLQVLAGDRLLREYPLELRDRRFEGSFGIRKLPHDGSRVEFRLYLSTVTE